MGHALQHLSPSRARVSMWRIAMNLKFNMNINKSTIHGNTTHICLMQTPPSHSPNVVYFFNAICICLMQICGNTTYNCLMHNAQILDLFIHHAKFQEY